MTLEELHSQKKVTAFVFKEILENLPYTSLQVLFSYYFEYIHFSDRGVKPLLARVDCCLKSFEEKQIILYLQQLPKKLYS